MRFEPTLKQYLVELITLCKRFRQDIIDVLRILNLLGRIFLTVPSLGVFVTEQKVLVMTGTSLYEGTQKNFYYFCL